MFGQKISGRRRIYNAQNTQRRAVADLQQLKIHSDGLSQICNSSKYTATGRRGFYNAQNTQRRAVADLQQLKIHSDGPSQICNNPSLCLTAFRIG